MTKIIKLSSQKLLSPIAGRRGMLTVEAAILVPLALMISVLIILVMLFEFQSVLMAAGMHQYGIIEMHEVTTERLNMKKGLRVAGKVELSETFEVEDFAGIRALKLDAVLEPDRRWLKQLKPVRGRSLHLRLPVNLLVYTVYRLQPKVAPDDE